MSQPRPQAAPSKPASASRPSAAPSAAPRATSPPKTSKATATTSSDSGFIISVDEAGNPTSKTDTQTARKKHKLFSDLRNVYNGYSNDVIGANVFAPSVGNEIRQAVLHSESVREAMDKVVAQKPNLTLSQVRSQVSKILSEMNAEPQPQVLRAVTYTVQKILKRLYRYVTIIDSQIDTLKATAKKAADAKVPLILIPCHKSHIDYLVLGWLFYQKSISVPFVAAGENLDLPMVGSLLQGCGAFFIRRQFGTDPLYRVVFHEYITQVLMRGYNLEFFIEGGRSRTGKLLNPKMGLLTVVCDAFFSGKLKDAYIVPVWIGYDKVIETEGYIQEMLGRAKPPESLLQLLRAIELLRLNFGSLEVRFGESYSLREMMESEAAIRGLSYQTGPESALLKARRQLVNVLAYRTMYQINVASAALPTALVVTTLLTQEGRGLSKGQLVQRVAWLRNEITKRGGVVCHMQGNPASVVDQVAVLLGSAIGRHTNLLEPVYTPAKRFELSYYRNSIMHLFVSESIIACSLYAIRNNNTRQYAKGVPKADLMKAAQYISRQLKFEFIYKPLPDFADNFDESLKWMIQEGILRSEEAPRDADQARSPSAGDQLISLDEEVDSNHMFKFLCFLIWPFVEAYWMVSAALYGLWPNHMNEEAELVRNIQRFGETLYYEGELNFYESVSKETIKLALARFYEREVIVRRIINEKGSAVIHLGEAYARDEAKMIKFANKMGQYRRRGKYRTSTGQVDTRAIATLITRKSKL